MTFVRRLIETPGTRRAVAALSVLVAGGLLAAGTSVGGGFPFGGSSVDEPDLILVNAEILTMDPHRPRASAIAITGDEVSAVGSTRSVARLRGRDTQTINLRGRTVIPGLIDGHTHAIRGGQTFDQETYWLDAGSLDEALSRVSEAANEREPGEWVAVVGSWHPNQFAERRPPTVAELTEASPTTPVYVQYLYDYAL
ncbi:MAG TPA: amidohydrolase family protein, partial [Actinomycetota bacterium]|nr:amidohydrolase family protein [Actinomycetota bacterium]